MSMCTHAINIQDGRIVYRTTRTDELVALYRKIDEETVKAIKDGKIGRMEVVNAIMGKEYASGTFNWKEFDQKRKELNMRTLDVEIRDIDTPADEQLTPDKRGEVMPLADIIKSAAKTAKANKEAQSANAEIEAKPDIKVDISK